MQVRGRRFDDGTSVSVAIGEGVITDITPVTGDANDPWLAPGFVDLQVNGYGGQEFNDLDLTTDQVVRVSLAMDADGVTSYLPTATTHSFEMLSSTMKILAAACEESPEVARRVPGFHLEGPYISKQDGPRGAHPLDHCRPPDWDEFQRLQEAAGGRIRILTLSPEYDGSAEFIAKAVVKGVLVAIGHTAANSDQIRAAVDAGASMSTHLGNAAHGQIRRHPNYIWDQLADDRLVASLIVDGHHLPSSVVKSFVRGKTPERCVLVSDLVGMAGMPPGQYTNTSIGSIEILDDGKIVVAGQQQYLAGAGLPITYGVANIMRYTDCDLRTAIEMASIRPAELIRQTPTQLAVGSRADFVAFDLPDTGPATVRQTINQGELVFDASDTTD
ncbi:MAG: amidohydrolase family protein [Planctomycetes bacterium]|nr:amidohydrolase family protein [Planctomycetota bacterium]